MILRFLKTNSNPVCLLKLTFLCVFFAGFSYAETGDFAETVADVRVRGNVVVPETEVLKRLDLRPGMDISLNELTRRVEEVTEWAGFGELSYGSVRRADGLHVTVFLQEDVRLDSIELRGNRRIEDRRLISIMPLETGIKLDAEYIETARRSILNLYHEEGYTLTSVEMAGKFHEDGSFTLVLGISEGSKLRVRRINFAGNDTFSRNRLRRIMDTHVFLPLPFIKRGLFDPDVFYEDLANIEKAYYTRGYLDAKAGGYWTYTDGFDGYELNVVIYEGPRYKVADIEVDGNRLFLKDELLREIELSSGMTYTPGKPAEIERKITRLYASQGLVDVSVEKNNLEVEPVFRPEDGVVDIRISITETDPVYVGRIRVEGLTKTNELVVLRHLRFEPGDRIDIEEFHASERTLRDTGYFDMTRPDAVDISLAPGEERFRDVIVRVREGPTGNLMLGGGVSSDAGFMASLSVTERNFDISNVPRSWRAFREGAPFRGGGQELSFMLNVGSERSDFEISFREPRIAHTDYSYGARAFSRLNRWEFFDVIRAGAGMSLGRRLGRHVYQEAELGLEHVHVSGMSDRAPKEIARDDGTYLKPYLDLSLRRDTRDSRMFPTTGYVARLGTEFTMLDIQTAKLTGGVTRYWTAYEQKNTRRQVFMLRGEAGIMGTYGTKTRIPVFERYYAGGMGSIRGFEWWGVSPVEEEQQEQVGGRSKLTGTAEYTIPLFTDHFRVAFFADAGYVEERARDVFAGWDKLRVSTGAGIRWFLPALGGIPITLDFAVPLEKEDYDVTRSLHFHMGLGHAF